MAAHEDDFAGFESAELMHARGLAAPVAEQICARYLEHGTWRRAIDVVLNRLVAAWRPTA